MLFRSHLYLSESHFPRPIFLTHPLSLSISLPIQPSLSAVLQGVVLCVPSPQSVQQLGLSFPPSPIFPLVHYKSQPYLLKLWPVFIGATLNETVQSLILHTSSYLHQWSGGVIGEVGGPWSGPRCMCCHSLCNQSDQDNLLIHSPGKSSREEAGETG